MVPCHVDTVCFIVLLNIGGSVHSDCTQPIQGEYCPSLWAAGVLKISMFILSKMAHCVCVLSCESPLEAESVKAGLTECSHCSLAALSTMAALSGQAHASALTASGAVCAQGPTEPGTEPLDWGPPAACQYSCTPGRPVFSLTHTPFHRCRLPRRHLCFPFTHDLSPVLGDQGCCDLWLHFHLWCTNTDLLPVSVSLIDFSAPPGAIREQTAASLEVSEWRRVGECTCEFRSPWIHINK